MSTHSITYYYHAQGGVICQNKNGLLFFLQGQCLSRSSLVPSTSKVPEPVAPLPVTIPPS